MGVVLVVEGMIAAMCSAEGIWGIVESRAAVGQRVSGHRNNMMRWDLRVRTVEAEEGYRWKPAGKLWRSWRYGVEARETRLVPAGDMLCLPAVAAVVGPAQGHSLKC